MTTSSKQAAMKYTITQSRLLYVLSIDDKKHRGLLKIGEVFVDNNVADDTNTENLKQIVRDILDRRSYMQGIKYALEYVEVTTYAQEMKCYKAEDVHRMLIKQGVERKALGKIDKREADYWFECELDKVKAVLKKIKSGEEAKKEIFERSDFRPEQLQAINETVEYFEKDSSKGKGYLWNAKMRFGKTLCGLEVASELKAKSTLIITHRPVVDKGWRDDFQKIFGGRPEYKYATRMSDEDAEGGDFYALTKAVEAGKTRLVFFVSMQYLRLSQFVGGKEQHFDPLKKAIMQYDWDFIMVDEAHEGIEADAGIRVMEKLKKDNTRILSLSGTPFNLLEKYEESEIYTWDYVMEQREKLKWDDEHFGDPNPYADLPRMQILTFTLPKMLRAKAAENNETFHFHHFFHVWTEDEKNRLQKQIELEDDPEAKSKLQKRYNGIVIGRFEHEKEINRFLDKLVEESDTSQYPFSTDEFRERFRHTFWILPGVKEAAEMERLLRKHKIFGASGMFHIINAAGDGNIEDLNGNALEEVLDNIRGYDPSKDKDRKRAAKKNAVEAKERTITLSCGKLTTGVSVPEWTAVLCMKGSVNTPAANYMQTIFRVQTPAVLNGRQKSDCYVFDFAPDRALTAVAETAKFSVFTKGKADEKMKAAIRFSQEKEKEQLEAFIKLCPVLSMDEGAMGKHITAGQIFEKLNNVYIERAVRSGYADNSIYNPEILLNLNPEQEQALEDVYKLLGSTKNVWQPEQINVNKNGLADSTGATQVKYVYLLTTNASIPPRPEKSGKMDANGCPMADGEWDDKMGKPLPLLPYLYVSNTRLIDGTWTEFSAPVLWKKYEEPDPDKEKAKRKREQENQEKRHRISVLRGVSIRIPLLVYGAEINYEKEEITVDNFTTLVDDASWEEYMPKGFTKDKFNLLKNCFDHNVFSGAPKRIQAMVQEADNLTIEDRIDKIATIFSYFHNPDKETVLTPWRVVNMHLSDCFGGWCFFNEDFTEKYTTENDNGDIISVPRMISRERITQDIFGDYNARILEINSKTGLYPLYMAYSLFRGQKEPAFRRGSLTGERGHYKTAIQYESQAKDDSTIWSEVLLENIFVICRTKMAVSITKRTLAGFNEYLLRYVNVMCYEHEISITDLVKAGVLSAKQEGITKQGNIFLFNGQKSMSCDMIDVLRAKPELFQQDVVKGMDFWGLKSKSNSIQTSKGEDLNNMKFKAIVGNPPYQEQLDSTRSLARQHFPMFIQTGIELKPNYLSLITPARWFTADAQDNSFPKLRNFIKQNNHNHFSIMNSYNGKELFPTTDLSTVCAFLWDSSHTGDTSFIQHFGSNSVMSRPLFEKGLDIILPNNEIVSILKKILSKNHVSLNTITTGRDAFGIVGKDFEARSSELFFEGAIKVQCAYEKIRYYDKKLVTKNKHLVDAYKIFTSKGNGGAGLLSDGKPVAIIGKAFVAGPNTACTDSLIPFGCFNERKEAENLQKYFCTKFLRFLVGILKVSQNLYQNVYEFVPLQDFSDNSDILWNDDIATIDSLLYKKYGFEDEEKAFIEASIRPIEEH